jgi:hypothetical protein
VIADHIFQALDKNPTPVRVPIIRYSNEFSQVPKIMKNVYEVLRQKELELTRLEKEVEALRVAAPLLSDEKESGISGISSMELGSKPTLATTVAPQQPIRIPQPAVNATPQPARAAGWEDTAKRWP